MADIKTVPDRRRSNERTFSAHCRWLGAPLKNTADRWCAFAEEQRFAVFTVWADRLVNGRYVFWNEETSPKDSRIGARELGKVIKAVMANGYDAYGILCEAKDPDASIRQRKYFFEATLLVLRFQSEPPGIVAYLQGELSIEDFRGGRRGVLTAFPSANDDINALPLGHSAPDRVSRTMNGYRRDDAVRRFVLSTAKGCCEYCGTPGFEMSDGALYLEAHHVQPLGRDGPDTIANVIALCAYHHREAHYGRNWEALEQAFRQRLSGLPNRGG